MYKFDILELCFKPSLDSLISEKNAMVEKDIENVETIQRIETKILILKRAKEIIAQDYIEGRV